MLRYDILRLFRVQILQISLRHRAGAVTVYHLIDQRDRRLREDTGRRINYLELVLAELVNRQVGLVLSREKNITDVPLDERRGRPARARIEHWHVLV